MKRMWLRASLTLHAALVLLAGGFLLHVWAQQVADPNFDTSVARPAYRQPGPKVLFDEAHLNFHTADGRYLPFVQLITHDGYQVTPTRQKFSAESLAGYDILVISNARGAEGPAVFETPAFSEAECEAVADWVRTGGALLLIADHAPFGAAAENLARRLGVEMSKGQTLDPAHADPETRNPSFILYTHENGLLADHPITRGRDPSEGIRRVLAFLGQSLKGPEGSVAFLQLAETAQDRLSPSPAEVQAAFERARAEGEGPVILFGSSEQVVSAAGRAQGVALRFGRGRVVVLGEAAMLSAQLMGPERRLFGMNRPGVDNRQLALNILHWLSGLLD